MARRSPTPRSSVWTDRRISEHRTEEPLSRERIVTAAVSLLDEGGLAQFSLRKLADRLGQPVTSLYWHVVSRDGLLELVADEVMGEVEIPDAAPETWRAGLDAYARGLREMVQRHPWTMQLMGAYPAVGPNAIETSDRVIRVLRAAGFDGGRLVHVNSLISSFAVGAGLLAATQSKSAAPDSVAGMESYLEQALTRHPDFAWWMRLAQDSDPAQLSDDGFEFGLTTLLDSLERLRG